MSNYDVLVTGAAGYHSPQIDSKTRLALLIYAKAIYLSPTTDYTPASGQRTLVQKAVQSMAGMPKSEFPPLRSPQELVIWFTNVGGVLGTASIHSKLAAIPYLLNSDGEVLAKTDVYITGLLLNTLT